MSGIACPECGAIRKVEQTFTKDGWVNPACWSCGDPGWLQPLDAEDPLAGRGALERFARESLHVAVTPAQAAVLRRIEGGLDPLP